MLEAGRKLFLGDKVRLASHFSVCIELSVKYGKSTE